MIEEKKVRVVELWNQVNDERKPRKSLSFNNRHILTTYYGEEVPEKLITELENLNTYEEAYKHAKQHYR